MTPELTLHFDKDQITLEKWEPLKPITAIYFDPDKKLYYLKRFVIENENKEESFIKENGELIYVSTQGRPVLKVEFVKPKGQDPFNPLIINAEEFISVKGIKAIGNQLTSKKIRSVSLKESLPYISKSSDLAPEDIEVTEEIHLGNEDAQITLDL
tara:strand:- start:1163 stop:1627 length:465 start_codon:yes stop_codon:yes gene_type:complete